MSQDQKPSSKKTSIDRSRRNFTKLGIATPVMATIASRPVWGSQCSPSAVLSHTNASHHPNAPTNCSLGCSPGYWKTTIPDWTKMTSYSRTDLFCTVFFYGKENDCPFPGLTLGQVISGNTASSKSALRVKHKQSPNHSQDHKNGDFKSVWEEINTASVHAIAALLNASAHEYDAIGGSLGYLNQLPNDIIVRYKAAYDSYLTYFTTNELVAFEGVFDQYGTNEVTCVFNANGDVSPDNYWVNQSMSFK